MDSRLHNMTIGANSILCGMLWTLGFLCLTFALWPGDHADSDVGRIGLALILLAHYRGVCGMLNRMRKLERNAFDLGRDSAIRHLRPIPDHPASNGDRH